MGDGPNCDRCKHEWKGPDCTERVLPCDDITCEHGGTCINTNSTQWKCQCLKNYEGERCQIELPCLTKQCLHNGTCENKELEEGGGKQAICHCKPGWKGSTCNMTSVCKADVCKNGGTCNDKGDGTYTCTCTKGYNGVH